MKSYAQRMKKPQISNLQQSTAATAQISNQAMLGMLNEPDGDTRFSEALRAKFAPKRVPDADGGKPLLDALCKKYEEKSGLPMDDVRVYYNSDEPARFDADAFTYGNKVYISPGKEKLMDHEMGHVVQQKKGMVHPTRTVNGFPLNDSEKLESDANVALSQNISAVQMDLQPVVQRATGRRHKSKQDKTERERQRKNLAFLKRKYLKTFNKAKENKKRLFLGEETFLYTKAYRQKHGDQIGNLIATCYNPLPSAEAMKYENATGATVRGSIDATSLKQFENNYFDDVRFHYPRLPRGAGSNKELILKSALGARRVLAYGGKFHLSIPTRETYQTKPGQRERKITPSHVKHIIYGKHIKRNIENLGFLCIYEKDGPERRMAKYGYEHRQTNKKTSRDGLIGKEMVFVKVPLADLYRAKCPMHTNR